MASNVYKAGNELESGADRLKRIEIQLKTSIARKDLDAKLQKKRTALSLVKHNEIHEVASVENLAARDAHVDDLNYNHIPTAGLSPLSTPSPTKRNSNYFSMKGAASTKTEFNDDIYNDDFDEKKYIKPGKSFAFPPQEKVLQNKATLTSMLSSKITNTLANAGVLSYLINPEEPPPLSEPERIEILSTISNGTLLQSRFASTVVERQKIGELSGDNPFFGRANEYIPDSDEEQEMVETVTPEKMGLLDSAASFFGGKKSKNAKNTNYAPEDFKLADVYSKEGIVKASIPGLKTKGGSEGGLITKVDQFISGLALANPEVIKPKQNPNIRMDRLRQDILNNFTLNTNSSNANTASNSKNNSRHPSPEHSPGHGKNNAIVGNKSNQHSPTPYFAPPVEVPSSEEILPTTDPYDSQVIQSLTMDEISQLAIHHGIEEHQYIVQQAVEEEAYQLNNKYILMAMGDTGSREGVDVSSVNYPVGNPRSSWGVGTVPEDQPYVDRYQEDSLNSSIQSANTSMQGTPLMSSSMKDPNFQSFRSAASSDSEMDPVWGQSPKAIAGKKRAVLPPLDMNIVAESSEKYMRERERAGHGSVLPGTGDGNLHPSAHHAVPVNLLTPSRASKKSNPYLTSPGSIKHNILLKQALIEEEEEEQESPPPNPILRVLSRGLSMLSASPTPNTSGKAGHVNTNSNNISTNNNSASKLSTMKSLNLSIHTNTSQPSAVTGANNATTNATNTPSPESTKISTSPVHVSQGSQHAYQQQKQQQQQLNKNVSFANQVNIAPGLPTLGSMASMGSIRREISPSPIYSTLSRDNLRRHELTQPAAASSIQNKLQRVAAPPTRSALELLASQLPTLHPNMESNFGEDYLLDYKDPSTLFQPNYVEPGLDPTHDQSRYPQSTAYHNLSSLTSTQFAAVKHQADLIHTKSKELMLASCPNMMKLLQTVEMEEADKYRNKDLYREEVHGLPVYNEYNYSSLNTQTPNYQTQSHSGSKYNLYRHTNHQPYTERLSQEEQEQADQEEAERKERDIFEVEDVHEGFPNFSGGGGYSGGGRYGSGSGSFSGGGGGNVSRPGSISRNPVLVPGSRSQHPGSSGMRGRRTSAGTMSIAEESDYSEDAITYHDSMLDMHSLPHSSHQHAASAYPSYHSHHSSSNSINNSRRNSYNKPQTLSSLTNPNQGNASTNSIHSMPDIRLKVNKQEVRESLFSSNPQANKSANGSGYGNSVSRGMSGQSMQSMGFSRPTSQNQPQRLGTHPSTATGTGTGTAAGHTAPTGEYQFHDDWGNVGQDLLCNGVIHDWNEAVEGVETGEEGVENGGYMNDHYGSRVDIMNSLLMPLPEVNNTGGPSSQSRYNSRPGTNTANSAGTAPLSRSETAKERLRKKLLNRYESDPEGAFAVKVKEYQYHQQAEEDDRRVLKEYIDEVEGWKQDVIRNSDQALASRPSSSVAGGGYGYSGVSGLVSRPGTSQGQALVSGTGTPKRGMFD